MERFLSAIKLIQMIQIGTFLFLMNLMRLNWLQNIAPDIVSNKLLHGSQSKLGGLYQPKDLEGA